jgi:hypothetical protein
MLDCGYCGTTTSSKQVLEVIPPVSERIFAFVHPNNNITTGQQQQRAKSTTTTT